MKTWKIISETDVSPSPWFPIQKHTIELPNGTIIDDYYITTLGNVAMVLPITTDNNIVMVKQYKHGIKDVVIELPAGFQQNGKSIENSALAELEEETGIKTSLDKLISIGKIANVPTKSSQISFGFLATGVTFNSTQNLDITEDIEIIKRTPTETLKMIQNGEIWVADTVAFIMKAYLMFPELFK